MTESAIEPNSVRKAPAATDEAAVATAVAPSPEEKPDPSKLPKTTGEKRYNFLKFVTAEAFILAATAGIAYISRYGKDSYKGIPNYLQRFQTWFEEDLLTKKIPLSERDEIGKLTAGALASALVTIHGGNLFAPAMKWFENSKHRIVDYFNRRSGKEGELEIGQERLKAEPRQTWGDVIKGRLAAFSIVFTSFFSASLIAGKDQQSGVRRFDKIEDWFGKKLAGFTKEGPEIAKLSIADRLNKAKLTNKTYKFGRILALDIYATTAAILIWNAISRVSARKRKNRLADECAAVPAGETPPVHCKTAEQDNPVHNYSNRLDKPHASHSAALTAQRQAMESDSPQLGVV
jgi:hypothetical protein